MRIYSPRALSSDLMHCTQFNAAQAHQAYRSLDLGICSQFLVYTSELSTSYLVPFKV